MTTLYKAFDNSRTQIINGSCIDFVDENADGLAGAFKLVFCDPPFNIGHGYDRYNDNKSQAEFEEFIVEFIGAAFHCLQPDGMLCVHVPDDIVFHCLLAMNSLGMRKAEWIIWHYRFGQCQQEHFIRSHAHLLCFVKAECEGYTFNGKDILVPSDRSAKYSDDRTLDSATPGMRIPLDVWCNSYDGAGWGRVTGNSKERWANHPNQLPEKYAERIIKVFTNPDDYIFDMFGGTGTFPTVARALNRCCICTEFSADYCEDIALRVEQGPVNIERYSDD